MENNTKEVNEKMNFFTRLKIAVFKLEDYGKFLTEKPSVAIKYLLVLLLLVSVTISLVVIYNTVQIINRGYEYIYNEMPDFNFENNRLTSTFTEAYDNDYDFRLIIDTTESLDENTLKNYREKNYDNSVGVIALNNRLLFIIDGNEQEYSYDLLSESFQITTLNRDGLINFMQDNVNKSFYGLLFVLFVSWFYLDTILVTISHVILLAILGYVLSGMLLKPKLRMAPLFSIAIYSLSLSTILNCIYICVNHLTGFSINMMDQIYYLVAVVYMIAALFMIKYDLIKQDEELSKELSKIYEVHEKTLKEIDENNTDRNKENDLDKDKEKQKDKKDDKKDEQDENNEELNNKEPDGSEI